VQEPCKGFKQTPLLLGFVCLYTETPPGINEVTIWQQVDSCGPKF